MLAKDIQIASDHYRHAMTMQQPVVHQTKFRVHTRWVPAVEGWLIVNTDGAVSNKYIVAYGGIIQNDKGDLIDGFAKNIGNCNVLYAEMWDVLKGICVAQRCRFNKVEFQVDNFGSC